MKFWLNNKVEGTLIVETMTCIALVADFVVAGCHSGNLKMIHVKSLQMNTTDQAHQNLIRGICSLQAGFRDAYFVTADVCGFVKVWRTDKQPTCTQTIQMPGAISYNCLAEMSGLIPTQQSAMLAVALKT